MSRIQNGFKGLGDAQSELWVIYGYKQKSIASHLGRKLIMQCAPNVYDACVSECWKRNSMGHCCWHLDES